MTEDGQEGEGYHQNFYESHCYLDFLLSVMHCE